MIYSKTFEDKTFEDLMEEALIQIPLYSKEWTNYNVSDPGITIIENLAAFQLLQQTYINQITDEVREKLLKMAGFEARKGKCARVLLQPSNVQDTFMLPANQKFTLGDLNYEINRQTEITDNYISEIYTRSGDCWNNCSQLLGKVDIPVTIFGKQPVEKQEIYLVFHKAIPKKQEVLCYVRTDTSKVRNLKNSRIRNEFANIKWECYTDNGFQKVKCKDYTGNFLLNGEIRFQIPEVEMKACEMLPNGGYTIRGTLCKANYDLAPSLLSISGFLFEAWQKDTRAVCYTFQNNRQIRLYCDLLEEDYVNVFCRENKGESYRLYQVNNQPDQTGRYYEKRRIDFGVYEFIFDRDRYQYGPGRLKDAVKIVAYNEQMMRQYELGVVYGYDEQEITLPVKHIVPESFSIIAERISKEGDKIYDFVKPNRDGEGELYYILQEHEGKILIMDAGDFIDARLLLGGCSVTAGEEGNVLENNIFLPVGYDSEVIFTNPARGAGGRFSETLDEVKKRFLQDINHPYTAVKGEDYEKLVKEIPELCIHKVKAMVNQKENEVRVVAKPYSSVRYPKLSELYQNAIYQYLDQRRLLSTVIKVIQPNYVGIDVRGTIYVKKHYEHSREQIEALLNRKLDYVNGEEQFGATVKFDEIFHEIEELECVEFVYELALYPQNSKYAIQKGMDIELDNSCLSYPGEYYLEVNTYIQ
ncbi:MAG: baseplate J/gp47 family protein [Lachnospiraceae bacterium]|nr:baseplate J/gp47 family protein [Lachnospiraceae bacterium]